MLAELVSSYPSADEASDGVLLIGLANRGGTREHGPRGPERGKTRKFVAEGSHLSTQPIENGECRLFGTRREITCGSDARRTAFVAATRQNQFARLPQKQRMCAEQRFGKADATRVGIVKIKIRLKKFYLTRARKVSEAKRNKVIRTAVTWTL